MKFQAQVMVVGMKSSKGTMESGQAYDSTKVYALVDLEAKRGECKGATGVEFTFGTSEEFKKYEHLPFPFKATAEFELVTSGKVTSQRLVGLKPEATAKA